MKTGYSILILLIIVFISSCQKEAETVTSSDSSLKAQKNSSNWVSTDTWGSYSETEQKFYLSAVRQHSKTDQDEELSISFVIKDLENPMITSDLNSEWVSVVGGTSIADGYHIDSSADNKVEILSVDTQAKVITGRFSVKLVRDSKFSDKGEMLIFNSGYFSVSYATVKNAKEKPEITPHS